MNPARSFGQEQCLTYEPQSSNQSSFDCSFKETRKHCMSHEKPCVKKNLGGRKGILLAKWMHLSMKSTKNSTSVSLKTLPMEDATLNMENGQQKLLQILQSWANDLCSKFKERAPFVLVPNLGSVLWSYFEDTLCPSHLLFPLVPMQRMDDVSIWYDLCLSFVCFPSYFSFLDGRDMIGFIRGGDRAGKILDLWSEPGWKQGGGRDQRG